MKKQYIHLFYFTFIINFAQVIVAQNKLSLSDAVKLGLERNFDIRIEQRKVENSSINNNWGEAGLFPNLTADLRGSWNTFDNRKAINPFSIIGKTITSQAVPSVNLNWNLMSIYGIKISKNKLEALEKESQGNAEIVVSNTLQSIILGYYVAVLERNRLNALKKQTHLSADKYQLLKLKKEMGSVSTVDVLLEEGNFLTDTTNYINQQLRYQNALTNLSFLIGEKEPNNNIELTDDLFFEDIEVDYDKLIVKLLNDNVNLRKQYLSESIFAYDVMTNKSQRLPNLMIGANINLTESRQDVSDWPLERIPKKPDDGTPLSIGYNENLTYGANFTISFTLFNGGKINRAIQKSMIQNDIANITTDKLLSSLKRDLAQAVDQYKFRKSLYEISERRYNSMKLNLDISKEKFENGSINSFDFRTIQTNYFNAEVNKLQALYNMIDSRVTIMRLTGGLVSNFN